MPTHRKPGVLTGLSVSQAMRRQVVRQPAETTIGEGIRKLVKFKSNALLVTGSNDRPRGVVTKTDLMGAYYATLPLSAALGDIMAGPPLSCFRDDGLETCLDAMQSNGIHQLYVLGAEIHAVIGVVDYGDVLGLLYRYCRSCSKGRHASRLTEHASPENRLHVKDVMTPSVEACPRGTPLTGIMEILSAKGFGAVLIEDDANLPQGVISKSDLMHAYRRNTDTTAPADSIMGRPVLSCGAGALLADAIQQMLVLDIQRLFVHDPDLDHIVGVLSLSNAARFRSGTCRACRSSRLITP